MVKPILPRALAAWAAFAVAIFLALPRPLDARWWVLGAASGVALCFAGFAAASRARDPIRARTLTERFKLVVAATASGALLGAGLLALLTVGARREPALRARFAGRLHEPAWRPWVLGFESSILEEIVFRLFLLSGVAWAVLFLSRKNHPSRRSFLVALLISSLAFGLAHLPAWASVTTMTVPMTAAVLLLNGIGGLLFGWVYWRWGLIYAICCHLAGDVVVQALGPRLLA